MGLIQGKQADGSSNAVRFCTHLITSNLAGVRQAVMLGRSWVARHRYSLSLRLDGHFYTENPIISGERELDYRNNIYAVERVFEDELSNYEDLMKAVGVHQQKFTRLARFGFNLIGLINS